MRPASQDVSGADLRFVGEGVKIWQLVRDQSGNGLANRAAEQVALNGQGIPVRDLQVRAKSSVNSVPVVGGGRPVRLHRVAYIEVLGECAIGAEPARAATELGQASGVILGTRSDTDQPAGNILSFLSDNVDGA